MPAASYQCSSASLTIPFSSSIVALPFLFLQRPRPYIRLSRAISRIPLPVAKVSSDLIDPTILTLNTTPAIDMLTAHQHLQRLFFMVLLAALLQLPMPDSIHNLTAEAWAATIFRLFKGTIRSRCKNPVLTMHTDRAERVPQVEPGPSRATEFRKVSATCRAKSNCAFFI